MVCALAIAMIDLAFPFISRWCMYKLLPDNAWRTFWTVMAVVFCAYILRSVFTYIITYWGHTFGVRIETDFRRDLFQHIQELSYAYFDNARVGQLMSQLTSELFDITELDMDSEEWDAYSIGDREDLDNDGEEELILCGPYGGKYLDARDGEVYEFAAGDGTAESLSYTYYQGYVWILYSNEMNSGYKVYHMERYDGADSKVNEMDFFGRIQR